MDGKILGRYVPIDTDKKKSIFYLDKNELPPLQPIKLTASQWSNVIANLMDLHKRVSELEGN